MNRREALEVFIVSAVPSALLTGSSIEVTASNALEPIPRPTPAELTPCPMKPCPADEDYVYRDIHVCRMTGPEDGPAICRTRKSRHYGSLCPKRARFSHEDRKCLRAALRLAAGELSTHEPHTGKHPEQVYDELLVAAQEPKHALQRSSS